MNPMFAKLVEKKKMDGKDESSPVEKQATDSVIQDLMQFLNNHEGEKLKGLKKVTVASNDPQGLEQGLAKAKEMVASGHTDPSSEDSDDDSSDDDMSDMDDSDDEQDPDSDEHSEDDHQEAPTHGGDPAELMKQIQMLKAQLAAKGHGSI